MAGRQSVRVLEPKKVPELAIGDGEQAKVYVPAGLTPEQWLKIREKTVLAGQLFKEQQFFLALNVVHEMPMSHLLYDYQLILIGLWTYLNLGFYAKAEVYCETILKKKDIPGLRRGLLMALHMQGKYEDALSYTTLLSQEETQEMSKLIQEVQVTYKNKVYPPYICAIGGHTTKLEEFLNHGGNANEIYQAPRLGPGNPSLLYLAAANGQDDVVKLLLGIQQQQQQQKTQTITKTINTTNTTTQQQEKQLEKDSKEEKEKILTTTLSPSPPQTPSNKIKNSLQNPPPSSRIADVEFENVGWKSIHIASYLGYTTVVAALIQGKANIHAKMFGSGSDPLQLALIGNNIITVRLLLANKANINALMPITPNLGIVENFILVPGTTTIKIDALQGPGYWHVVAKGRTELLKQLILDKQINVNIQNKTNRHATFLHFATGRGITGERCDFPTVKMLLENKADANILTESGYSPLHFACRCGDSDTLPTVQYLIKYGANVNAITRYNETPLVCALSADNVPVVKELLISGANIEETELQLKQPVMAWTVLQGTNYLVKSVLEGYWTRLSQELDLPLDLPGSTPMINTITPTKPETTTTTLTTTTKKDPKKVSIPKTTTPKTTTTPPPPPPSSKNLQYDPEKIKLRQEKMSLFINTRSNKIGLAALHWAIFKGDWVNVGLLLRYGADPLLECEYENVICTPLRCSTMYWLGKQFGTEKEDMEDCGIIIKQSIAIIKGEEPEKPIIHDFELKDDITDTITQKQVDIMKQKKEEKDKNLAQKNAATTSITPSSSSPLQPQQQQQQQTQFDQEEEYDEDWFDGEGEDEGELEWIDDGEGWMDEYEYDEEEEEEGNQVENDE